MQFANISMRPSTNIFQFERCNFGVYFWKWNVSILRLKLSLRELPINGIIYFRISICYNRTSLINFLKMLYKNFFRCFFGPTISETLWAKCFESKTFDKMQDWTSVICSVIKNWLDASKSQRSDLFEKVD